jgi:hypothetical protein
MDPGRAKATSQAFWHAAERNFEQRRIGPRQFKMPLVPAVVSAAFSVELGIKAFLLSSGAPSRGHDLAELFGKLPEELRARLAAATAAGDSFESSLGLVARAFEEWRYIYEVSHAEIDIGFLRALADAMYLELDAAAF